MKTSKYFKPCLLYTSNAMARSDKQFYENQAKQLNDYLAGVKANILAVASGGTVDMQIAQVTQKSQDAMKELANIQPCLLYTSITGRRAGSFGQNVCSDNSSDGTGRRNSLGDNRSPELLLHSNPGRCV